MSLGGVSEVPWHHDIVALATRHGKEHQISPALAAVGLVTRVVAVDTDRFGTFSGEIQRPGPPDQVVLTKARAGLEIAGLPRGVASEGTLGPHPDLPMLTCDRELVGFVDLELGFTLIEEALGFETTVASRRAQPGDDLEGFLRQIDFGPQGVIVRRADHQFDPIVKGIVTIEALHSAIKEVANCSADGYAVVETDLRAHLCPTRQRVIREAADRLAERLGRRCPSCACPGFGIVAYDIGLECASYGAPTGLERATIEGCMRCDLRKEVAAASLADPSTCPMCNP